MNWKSLALLIGLSLATVSVPAATAQKESSASKAEVVANKQENDVRTVLIELANAVTAGDAQKVASLWSADAIFIDQTGQECRGRAALQERLTARLKESGLSDVGLHPTEIKFPATNVALIVGSVSRKNGAAYLPVTRFSLVLVKDNDTWLIKEATETAIRDIAAADHLKQLEWLIGKWQVNKPDSAATLDVEWAPGRSFIVSKAIATKGGTVQTDSQVIGWDPRNQSIVSWHFNFNGGFGYGTWSKQADRWLVDFAGVGTDGSETRATNIFTVGNGDEFTWQATQQSADGVPVADTEAIKIKKAKS